MIELRKSDHAIKRETIFVFFSGGWAKEQKTAYNFLGTARDLGCPSIFVRDVSGNFYNTENFYEAVKSLSEMIYDIQYNDLNEEFEFDARKVVFVGTSMGGYGAIKFSNTGLKPDKIVAFSPQIAWDDPPAPNLFWDFTKNQVPLDIHYCTASNYKTDDAHARAMSILPCVKLIRHEGTVHNVAGMLKEQKKLLPILQQEI